MLPSFLITFREVIEAALIVATILGILVKLGHKKSIRTVWWAVATASIFSIFLIGIASIIGLRVQELFQKHEAYIEGILTIVSSLFITWAVFFLHKYFASYKTHLLAKIRNKIETQEQEGLFSLVFTAVFREGIEIVLFLSTVYFSSNPQSIFSGFLTGAILALMISFGLFTATLKLPVFYAFRITSLLLIFFAAGLLARGVHEFIELGFIPEVGKMTLFFIPSQTTFVGEMINSVFGITQKMDLAQIGLYGAYVAFMFWWILRRKDVSVHRH